jgi:hypothetical protein
MGSPTMPVLSQNACFSCRKVFKKPHFEPSPYPKDQGKKPPVYRCPDCGADMIPMGYRFRAPKRTDTKAWGKIEESIRLGIPWAKPTIRKKPAGIKISAVLEKALGMKMKTSLR